MRWLRKNAARFQLDAEHIGAIGGSAGGHLTALLAVSGPDVGIDPKEDADYSCRIQAAVPMYAHCAASWEGSVPPKPYPNLSMFAKPQAEAPALWDSALAYQTTVERRPAHADPARHGRQDHTAGSVHPFSRGSKENRCARVNSSSSKALRTAFTFSPNSKTCDRRSLASSTRTSNRINEPGNPEPHPSGQQQA